MNLKLCAQCKQAVGCDQVPYDCPICDFKGKSYAFTDNNGNAFQEQFKSLDNARDFADYSGFKFEGGI